MAAVGGSPRPEAGWFLVGHVSAPLSAGGSWPILSAVPRIASGLTAAVLALLCAAPAAPAAKCKPKNRCGTASHATGWHHGTYDGGPGDPIIAPVPVRARH